ncbi:hypothetical protein CHU93_16760 [Sandarakinorhabdus cyanobacteriorum]|uniref:Uncharacterized protein n=1 Tax=Sandarakinorhabdus cyanobacteriorum TaxID=1981098 RepID=A0A255Y430_9SPHN|nr:hypothetical protein CHU93_16760 [Sandarakinorhabdus cyanobacteriorum]
MMMSCDDASAIHSAYAQIEAFTARRSGDPHAIGEDITEWLDVVSISFRVLVTRRTHSACAIARARLCKSRRHPRSWNAACLPVSVRGRGVTSWWR